MCAHRSGPLADGLIDGEQVVCLLHNHTFRLANGHCTTGESPKRVYQVAVENDELVLRLPDPGSAELAGTGDR